MVGRILHRIIRSAGGAGGEAMLWAETDVTPGIYISSFSLHVFQQLCHSRFPFYPLLSLMEFNLTFRIGNYIINYHRATNFRALNCRHQRRQLLSLMSESIPLL